MGRMVTREFSYQKLTILVYNKVTKANEEMEITIPDAEYTSRRLENTINKVIDTNVYKMIDVLNTESFKELRGMSQEDFLKNSQPLPPRKVLAAGIEDYDE